MRPSMLQTSSLRQALLNENPAKLIVGLLLVMYILVQVPTPAVIAPPIDSIYGQIVLAFLVIIFFYHTNPVLGVLGAIAAYTLYSRSSLPAAIQRYVPSEALKVQEFARYNDFSATLEEDVVATMAPLVRYDGDNSGLDYKPVLEAQHAAAPLDQ